MKIGIREIIFFVLLLCIPLGAWLFVFKPDKTRAAEISKEIQAKQHNLAQTNLASASIAALGREVTSLEEAMEYFKSKLPNQRQTPMVLKEISNLVTTHELKLVSIRPANKASSNQIKFVPEGGPHLEQAIDIRVEGDFQNFYLFLQALESLPRITRIQELILEGNRLNDIKTVQRALNDGTELNAKRLPMGHVIVKFKMSIFFERAAG